MFFVIYSSFTTRIETKVAWGRRNRGVGLEENRVLRVSRV